MTFRFVTPPEFLSLPIFGLDISASSIKICKLKKQGNLNVPQYTDEVFITETCSLFTKIGEQNDCEQIKKTLRDLKKKYNIEFVRVSVPETETYVFRVNVPQDALHTVEEFITYNMDQYVPLDPQEVFFDYKILKAHIDNKTVPVVVTAIPKNIIEQYTALIESCGIYIVSFEAETHAIAKAVIDNNDMNPYIIINVDQYSTNISVVEEGLVQYTQTLPFSGEDMKGEISPNISNALKDSINKVIIYWFTNQEQKHTAAKIENIILTGEVTNSSHLINFFESNLFVNASFGNIWKNCFDLNEFVPFISKSESLKYATCVGLCLGQLK